MSKHKKKWNFILLAVLFIFTILSFIYQHNEKTSYNRYGANPPEDIVQLKTEGNAFYRRLSENKVFYIRLSGPDAVKTWEPTERDFALLLKATPWKDGFRAIVVQDGDEALRERIVCDQKMEKDKEYTVSLKKGHKYTLYLYGTRTWGSVSWRDGVQ